MTGIESMRNMFKTDKTLVFDAENVGKVMVSVHHYLHHVLLAGNFSDAGKSPADSVKKEPAVESLPHHEAAD